MNPSCLCHDQLIVDGDKRPSHLILADADALSHKDEKWEKKPDHHPADFLVEEEVLSPEDGEQQSQPAADQESDDRRENNSHDQGQTGMDVRETDVGDEPQSHGGDDQGAASQQEEEDEDPLFRPIVGLSFLCLFDPVAQCVVHLLPQNRPYGQRKAAQKGLCRQPVFPRILQLSNPYGSTPRSDDETFLFQRQDLSRRALVPVPVDHR